MSNQYEVLGKAPTPEDLKKLSPDEIHLTIKNLNAGYGKMEILHNFDLFVNKAQSLCLIGPNGAGKSTILHSIYGFTNIFSGQIEIDRETGCFIIETNPENKKIDDIFLVKLSTAVTHLIGIPNHDSMAGKYYARFHVKHEDHSDSYLTKSVYKYGSTYRWNLCERSN